MNKKKKRQLIAIIVTVVLLTAAGVGLWMFLQYRNDQKTVEVLPVSQVAETNYWGNSNQSSGRIVSDYVQELYPDSSKTVSELFVEEGQQVKIGDPLLQFDKEQLELNVKKKENTVAQAELDVKNAERQLKKLQNTKPAPTYVPIVPTKGPTSRPTSRPTTAPRPTPAPSIRPADVTVYSQLDLNSLPYRGSGTTDDPYVFLCTDDCLVTPQFLRWLMGSLEDDELATPTPQPTSDAGENSGEESSSSEGEVTPSPSLTPEPTMRPVDRLVSPFAAIFEVREGDSNYGSLISAFQLDGTKLSANFLPPDSLSGNSPIQSVAVRFGATPTPKTTANPDNYNDMGYTAAELKTLIEEKKREITDLQLTKKRADLELERAKLQLRNSTVLSTVDGVVRTLLDQEAAAMENKPFLVVSGASTYYVVGAISENVLGSVQVGSQVTVMDYMTGSEYQAEIVSISDYPLDSNSDLYYYGEGNPNSSNYEFTAVLPQDSNNLQNGQYVDITIDVTETEDNSTGTLYLNKPYLREDETGSYVMKAGIDNRLFKQYVETGKTIYGGEYVEIRYGLTIDDYVAFPYGPDVKEGVRVVLEGSEEGPMTGADNELPILTAEGGAVID